VLLVLVNPHRTRQLAACVEDAFLLHSSTQVQVQVQVQVCYSYLSTHTVHANWPPVFT
jgi:hypothetical protein